MSWHDNSVADRNESHLKKIREKYEHDLGCVNDIMSQMLSTQCTRFWGRSRGRTEWASGHNNKELQPNRLFAKTLLRTVNHCSSAGGVLTYRMKSSLK